MIWLSRLIYGSPKQEVKPEDIALLSQAELIKRLEEKNLILVDGESIDIEMPFCGRFAFHKDLTDPKASKKVQQQLLRVLRNLVDRSYNSNITDLLSQAAKIEDDGTLLIDGDFQGIGRPPFLDFLTEKVQQMQAKHGVYLENIINTLPEKDRFKLDFGIELFVQELITNLHELHGKIPVEEPEHIKFYKEMAKWALTHVPRDVLEIMLHNETPFRYKADPAYSITAEKDGKKETHYYSGSFNYYNNMILVHEGGGDGKKTMRGVELILYNRDRELTDSHLVAVHEAGHSIFNWDQSNNEFRVVPPLEKKELEDAIKELRTRVGRIEGADPEIWTELKALKKVASNLNIPENADPAVTVPEMTYFINLSGQVIGSEAYEKTRESYGDRIIEEYLVDWLVLMQTEKANSEMLEFISPKMCQITQKLILDRAAKDLDKIRERVVKGESPEEARRNLMRDMVRGEITGERAGIRTMGEAYYNLSMLR